MNGNGYWMFDENAEVEPVVIRDPEFETKNIDSIKAFFKSHLQGNSVVNRAFRFFEKQKTCRSKTLCKPA